MKTLSFFSATLFLLISSSLSAKHMGLSTLTYRNVRGTIYHFEFVYYQDCIGAYPPVTVTMNMHSTSCGYDQDVTLIRDADGIIISNNCPADPSVCSGGNEQGIRRWNYELELNIPGQCPDWIFGISLCCRSAYFTNVQAPYYDSYAEARLDNSVSNNSSPYFTNEAVLFHSIGSDFHYNNGIIDPDGDSLAIAMVAPMMTANSFITYLPGYNAQNPVSSSPPAKFDPATGELIIHPTAAEISIMSFRVDEFRNGNLIGRVTRDVGIFTGNRNDNLPVLSGINGTAVDTTAVFPGTTLCFDIFSDDADAGDVLSMSWNNSIAGASFVSTSSPHPTGTFCWTPELYQVREQPYYFTVTVKDDNCPLNNVEIYSYSVKVSMDSTLIFLNMQEEENELPVTISPNPSRGKFTVTTRENIHELIVTNPLGEFIRDEFSKNMFDLSGETSGIYFIRIFAEDGKSVTRKIILY